ncbi:hypothetical protein LK994_10670 [Ferruginibacter lapsinanis]|uniref:beta strand repeat-containing protein n=1 Tax=Ferruginibacter lapsinanis TaxID=563172 RepID=UPI001E4AC54E|nr:sugar-binding protein [Ferruginibacter lapsinanis]UEG49093.1 hypothetical protein LK994_10670 [Ferruginibacter lapsinanis]
MNICKANNGLSINRNVKKLLFTFLTFFALINVYAANISSNAVTGNWNSTASWAGGVIPAAGDNVTIVSGANITVSVAITQTGTITVNSGGTLTLGATLTSNGSSITINGTLNCGANIINGSSNFTLSSANTAILMIGSPNGITTTGTASGSIQNSGATRSFGASAAYVYNGTANQVTGNGLPASIGALVINNSGAASNNIVTLTTSPLEIKANPAAGSLTLTQGIFKIGAGNTLNFNNNSSTNSLANNGGDLATTGTNGADGGKIVLLNGSGANFTISGSSTVHFYDLSFGTAVGGGNRNVVQSTANTVIINGTLTMQDNQSKWSTNSPAYGSNATLFVNNNGQGYTPGAGQRLEWMAMSSGTIGTTAGYPNNVTLVNMGTSQNNGCGFGPSGTWCINGTLSVGDGTTAGMATLQSMTAFTCGGITIDNNSTLKHASETFTVKGNWRQQGTTVGVFSPTSTSSSAIIFGGSGTSVSPQTISISSGTVLFGTGANFSDVTINNGTYVKLNSPATIFSTKKLTLTSGILETSSTNILSITNTATTGISGTGSSTNFINGPVKWSLLNSGTNTYTFPVGSGTTYLPLVLSSKNTAAGNVATVTAFATNSLGSADGTTLTSISNTEYWSMTTSAGLGTTGSSISISRQTAISPLDAIGKSTSANGIYSSLAGSAGTYGVTGSNDIGTASPWFFVLAKIIPPPPTVTTVAASSIGTTSATLNATINAYGQSTATSFEYGTTVSYGSSVTGSPATVTGTGNTSVTGAISGLIPNTLYDFRANGVYGSSITVNGSNLTFTTLSNAPTVGMVSAITTTGFTANWTAPTGQGSEAFTYTIQVSTDPTFATGNTTVTGISSGTLTYAFTGSSATTYYYHVLIVNAGGSSAWSATSAAVTTTFTVGPSCSNGTGASNSPSTIKFTSSNPAIDGGVDALWSNAPANNISQSTVGSYTTTNGTSTWKALYTADTLYMLVQITDANLWSTNTTVPGDTWRSDGIEIYLDGNNSKGTSYDNYNDVQIRINWGTGTVSGVGTPTPTSIPINYRIPTVTGGYLLEIAIPWTGIVTTGIADGKQIGLDVEVNDNDNGVDRTSQGGWYTSNSQAFNNASLFGTAGLTLCQVPVVINPTATNITASSADLGATVSVANGTLVSGGHGTAYNTSTGVTSQNASGISGTAVVGTPFSHTVSGLSPQTYYYYVGYATNQSGTGISTEGAFWSLSNPPTAQPAFTTASATCSSVTLNWNTATFPVSGATATGYILLRKQGASPTTSGIVNATAPGNFSLPSGTTLVTVITSGSTLTYTNTSLTAGTTYSFLLVPFTWDNVHDSTRNYLTNSTPPSQSITLSTSGTWLGVNTNWNDSQNWCNGVPTSADDVVVPDYGVGGIYPIITSGVAATCKNYNMAVNASVTIDSGGSLAISGTYTSNGTLINNGDVLLNSSSVAQSFPGATGSITAMNNLTVNNTSGLGVTFDKDFFITGALTPTAGNIDVNNALVTLISTATATARVGIVASNINYTGTGQFCIERYLPMLTSSSGRRWRLLGVPISSINAPTINAAWQEGATPTPTTTSATSGVSIYNPKPGYGTHITNGTGSSNNANGFDAGSTSNPSIYKMDPGTGTWTVPSSTGVTITNNKAYMIFVRGDRSIQVSNQYINTTGGNNMRIKGRINTGNDTVGITGAGKYVVSNPYPSAISFNNIDFMGLTPGVTSGVEYYMWDPKLLGSKNVGGFVTFSSAGGGTYTKVPYTAYPGGSTGISAYSNTGIIESGGAFMIESAGAGSIIFHETDKITANSTVGIASRPLPQSRPQNQPSEFYINLLYKDGQDSSILADGVAATFSNNYHNEVDEQDAPKMQTFQTKEKISLVRDNNILAIERRAAITMEDTIFLQLIKLDFNYRYQLHLFGKDFAADLDAFLIDKYLQQVFPLTTSGLTRHDFETNGDANSLAADRFMVVFKLKAGAPLPVKFIDVNAWQNTETINVQWNVAEDRVKEYQIERSIDGIHFVQVGIVAASGKSTYNWIDEQANAGVNYYRIISIGNAADRSYSKVVSVRLTINKNMSVVIYPNPIKNNQINLYLKNMLEGEYNVRVLNSVGQLMTKDAIIIKNADLLHQTIGIKKVMVKSVYYLEITGPGNFKKMIEIKN